MIHLIVMLCNVSAFKIYNKLGSAEYYLIITGLALIPLGIYAGI